MEQASLCTASALTDINLFLFYVAHSYSSPVSLLNVQVKPTMSRRQLFLVGDSLPCTLLSVSCCVHAHGTGLHSVYKRFVMLDTQKCYSKLYCNL